jgi:peptide/nickel transport system permease protein
MSLTGYVVRRLLQAVPVALGVTILVFFLIHLLPGDPARTILANHATPQRVALLRHNWGLDRPLPVQYEKFMRRLAQGDLGSSLFYGVGAGRLVRERLPVTLWLICFGALLSVLIAVPLALLAASRHDGVSDHLIRGVPLVGLGFPPFWI